MTVIWELCRVAVGFIANPWTRATLCNEMGSSEALGTVQEARITSALSYEDV